MYHKLICPTQLCGSLIATETVHHFAMCRGWHWRDSRIMLARGSPAVTVVLAVGVWQCDGHVGAGRQK